MKKIKSLIVAIGVLSGCLTFAVIGYAGMGGGHHGSNDRIDNRYGYNHSNGSHHDSNYNDHHGEYNDHHRDNDNSQGYNRSNGHRSRSTYGHHNDGIANHELNNGDYIDRYPGNAIQHPTKSAPER